jgi:hypothetical protein
MLSDDQILDLFPEPIQNGWGDKTIKLWFGRQVEAAALEACGSGEAVGEVTSTLSDKGQFFNVNWTNHSALKTGDKLYTKPQVSAVPDDVLTGRVANLLHLLEFATITTPTPSDAQFAENEIAAIKAMLSAAPQPAKAVSEEEPNLRSTIIDALLSTAGLSEGVTADAILSVINNKPRITEQDARAIIADYSDYHGEFDRPESWINDRGRALLAKLNEVK